VAIAGRGEIAEFAGAGGESREHGVTVRDGFVAGEFEAAGERFDALNGFRLHDEGQFSMVRKSARRLTWRGYQISAIRYQDAKREAANPLYTRTV